ncbi:MAG: FAD-dependent oxidoreductase [Deltaproteobacteria bacterium]|nr:FAD-dependent oxidoreductase [Deltaproteobacteria bacterium]
MIIILGAGLSGLSAAFHLKGREYQIFEGEGEVGGLCRSVVQDGFTFDYTGHLLHLHHPYTQGLLEELLPDLFARHQRRAAIYLGGRYIPYPFQANLWALPKQMIRECLLGYIRAYCDKAKGGDDFLSWIYQAFGPGIAKYFMIPYNEKLWRIPLQEISLEWVERFVPCPTLEEVIDGALGINLKGFGYNQEFLYPIQGGIKALPQAFLPKVGDVHLGKEAKSIDIEKRMVRFKDGSEVAYHALISSLPLNELVRRIASLPEEINDLGGRLRYVSVLNINLGVKRARVSDYHWIYYPEPPYPFYRVGFPSNLSPRMAPKGASSLSVEISYLPSTPPSVEEVRERTLSALISCGILRDDDEVLAEKVLMIKHAYVIYDPFRRQHLPRIFQYLRSQHIYPIGRYGHWGYATMEETLLQGRDVAKDLL